MGGVDKGRGHCQSVLVGSGSQHAQAGGVGTRSPSKQTLLKVPDQDKGLGRTHEPVLRKSPVDWGHSDMLETRTWTTTQQGKSTGDKSAQQY